MMMYAVTSVASNSGVRVSAMTEEELRATNLDVIEALPIEAKGVKALVARMQADIDARENAEFEALKGIR